MDPAGRDHACLSGLAASGLSRLTCLRVADSLDCKLSILGSARSAAADLYAFMKSAAAGSPKPSHDAA